jgi:hypothetical protein
MVSKDRVRGFNALIASHKSKDSKLEDVDGDFRYWKELSTEGKLKWIASDATYYDVPFEPFANAVREVLCDLPAPAREEAALRLVLQAERERRELEKLLPSYGRLEEARPLVDRFKDVLDCYEELLANEPGKDHDPENTR